MLGEVKGYMTNHMIIENVCIKKVYKQLFSTKLIMEIILKREWSHAKSYIEVQKDQ